MCTYVCICMYMICIAVVRVSGGVVDLSERWPLQDSVSLRSFRARVNHPFKPPSHLHCPDYCNAIARPLRNIRRPPDPPCVCHTSYNIGNGNIV